MCTITCPNGTEVLPGRLNLGCRQKKKMGGEMLGEAGVNFGRGLPLLRMSWSETTGVTRSATSNEEKG